MKKIFHQRAFAHIFFLLPLLISAQRVASKDYDNMLNQLLSHSVREISVKELVAMNAPILLDARSVDEYNISHIPGAKWFGSETLNSLLLDSLNKSKPVVVYCSVGYRSEKISEQLIKKGFKNVSNLYGGIFEWVNEKHTVINSEGHKTEQVHAYNKKWGVWLIHGTKVY